MEKDSTGLLILLIMLLVGCGSPSKLRTIESGRMGASLALSRSELAEERRVIARARRDTLSVEGENGERILIMKAIKDDETGEMVATDVLDAAVVTARFRNVAYIDPSQPMGAWEGIPVNFSIRIGDDFAKAAAKGLRPNVTALALTGRRSAARERIADMRRSRFIAGRGRL